jgi:hypothetical protein
MAIMWNSQELCISIITKGILVSTAFNIWKMLVGKKKKPKWPLPMEFMLLVNMKSQSWESHSGAGWGLALARWGGGLCFKWSFQGRPHWGHFRARLEDWKAKSHGSSVTEPSVQHQVVKQTWGWNSSWSHTAWSLCWLCPRSLVITQDDVCCG